MKSVFAAALAFAAGTSMAADDATVSITSFAVSAASSNQFAWAVEKRQQFEIRAFEDAGWTDTDTALRDDRNWNMGPNLLAQTASARADGNLVQFTDAMTQVTTPGFHIGAAVGPGSAGANTRNRGLALAQVSGSFTLLDDTGAYAAGILSFDVYYTMGVTRPNRPESSFAQTGVSFTAITPSFVYVDLWDDLHTYQFPGGTGSTAGHFTWSYGLRAGEKIDFRLSGYANSLNAVPEPSTYALMYLGIVCVGSFARRRCGSTN